MSKWSVTICVMSLVCFISCGNKKSKETNRMERVPPPPAANTAEVKSQESNEPAESPAEKPLDKNYSSQYASELADLGVGELWKVYKACRTDAETAKEQGNYKKSIQLMLKGAEAAIKLERPGIVSWQFNNAAKHAIDYFKAESDYTERMRMLPTLKHGDEKINYKKETKAILKEHFTILTDARSYLKAATKYNEMKSDPKRTSAIESNMGFITEIASYIE